jgi:hypothetical protein|tara:strand:- start:2104 stop:2595 length:492 start_codon:yes stop_codon:yes gene_type:complete
MKTEVTINIDDYLSEEEKKEIAIDVFRNQVKTQLFKSIDGTVQSDSEVQRVIGNISYEVVFNEVQKYIPNAKKMVEDKVSKILKEKDLSYYIFRKKDAWDKEESLAITYLNQGIKSNEETFKTRIRKEMEEYDLGDDLNKELSNKFDKLADTMYSLSDLFINK